MSTSSRHFPLVRDMNSINLDGEPVLIHFLFPPEYADWLYVGVFKHADHFQEANLRSLQEALRQLCGSTSFATGVVTADEGRQKLFSAIIIRDLPEAMALAATMMDTHEEGEHICDETYWQVVDVHLQRMWTDLSIPDRIDYVKRTRTPPSVALDPYVSEEHHYDLWTMLYQEMGL